MPTQPGMAHVIITLKHASLTRPAALTLGVDPTMTEANLIATAVYTAATGATSLKSIIDTSVTIGPVTAFLGQDGGDDISGVSSATTLGTSSISSVTPNCALLVVKHTARGGRRGKGRMFIPWAVATNIPDEAGILGGASITTYNTALAAFLAALNAGNVPMVLLHKEHIRKDGTVSVPPAADPVTALVAQNLISTQRRRLGR